jgi:hypothetical protein
MANTELQTTNKSQLARPETFAPRNIREAFDFADMVLMSGMAPKAYMDIVKEKGSDAARAAVVVALQFGMEVGFQPMQALQSIANINNNPAVWGDGALALVQGSSHLEWIKEDDLETIKKNKKATCQVKRRGDPEVKTVTFSYDDAEKSGIIKRGVWLTYPHRMCQMRARAFALRDKFPDVLKGLKIVEEVLDYVDLDAAPEQPKIQATVVVPQSNPTPTEPSNIQQTAETVGQVIEGEKTVEAQVEKSEGDEIITREEAVAYFKAYSASLWLKEESLAFLKTFNPPYESSLVIKKKDYAAAMKWASTPRPKPETQVEENMDSEPNEEWNGTLPTE